MKTVTIKGSIHKAADGVGVLVAYDWHGVVHSDDEAMEFLADMEFPFSFPVVLAWRDQGLWRVCGRPPYAAELSEIDPRKLTVQDIPIEFPDA